MSGTGRILSNQWIVNIIGGLIVAILAALLVPKIVTAVTNQRPHGAGAVKIPIGTACKWAYPERATGIATGSGEGIVCLGANGELLGGFPDGSGHSLNDWCANSAHTDGMNLIQAKLTPNGWVCTFLQ